MNIQYTFNKVKVKKPCVSVPKLGGQTFIFSDVDAIFPKVPAHYSLQPAVPAYRAQKFRPLRELIAERCYWEGAMCFLVKLIKSKKSGIGSSKVPGSLQCTKVLRKRSVLRRYKEIFGCSSHLRRTWYRGLSAIGAAKGNAHVSPRTALRSKEKKSFILEIDKGHAD